MSYYILGADEDMPEVDLYATKSEENTKNTKKRELSSTREDPPFDSQFLRAHLESQKASTSSSRTNFVSTDSSNTLNVSNQTIGKKTKTPTDNIDQVFNQEWRLRLHNLIKQDKLKFDNCKIFDYFESYYVVPKNSGSKSSTTFTRYLHEIDGNKLFVSKIWWNDTSSSNSLDYEASVYEIIINFLIKNNFTPHVVSYLALGECSFDNFSKAFSKSLNDLKGLKQILHSPAYNHKTLKILMTENVKHSKTFKSLIEDTLYRNEHIYDLMSICFQILYTYECFNRIGLRHNDGHLSNILVTDYSKTKDFPEFIIYELNQNTYAKVPIRYFVRMIDFDLSSFNCNKTKINPFYYSLVDQFKTKIGDCKNEALTEKFCSMFDLCNNVEHTKFDTYQTFWLIRREMVKYNPTHSIIKWLDKTFGDFKGEYYDKNDHKSKKLNVERWLKKENDTRDIMFPIDIMLSQFPAFVKKKDATFLQYKTKYPSFVLPLSLNEQPYYNKDLEFIVSDVKDIKPRFVSERQGIIDANDIYVSEDEKSGDDQTNENKHVVDREEYGLQPMDISPTQSYTNL